MTRNDFINRTKECIASLDENNRITGFDLSCKTKFNDDIVFAVRCMEIADEQLIMFGGYTMGFLSFTTSHPYFLFEDEMQINEMFGKINEKIEMWSHNNQALENCRCRKIGLL